MSSAASHIAPASCFDRKRYAWLLSLLVPVSIATGPLLWLWHPATLMLWLWLWLWLPVMFTYLVAPLLDLALGSDPRHPLASAVRQLAADAYYRRVTIALVPLLWSTFICAAWFSQWVNLS